ncbi:MAG: hypothetical protein K1X78_28940 [Verrucomicrobiaceae bacterium]|nr:hypothetical protein [Verrucomicrobiaceae bacterium]
MEPFRSMVAIGPKDMTIAPSGDGKPPENMPLCRSLSGLLAVEGVFPSRG